MFFAEGSGCSAGYQVSPSIPPWGRAAGIPHLHGPIAARNGAWGIRDPPRTPGWLRSTGLCSQGDFCILFCFVLRCLCNCRLNPAWIILLADGARRRCPGPLLQTSFCSWGSAGSGAAVLRVGTALRWAQSDEHRGGQSCCSTAQCTALRLFPSLPTRCTPQAHGLLLKSTETLPAPVWEMGLLSTSEY